MKEILPCRGAVGGRHKGTCSQLGKSRFVLEVYNRASVVLPLPCVIPYFVVPPPISKMPDSVSLLFIRFWAAR